MNLSPAANTNTPPFALSRTAEYQSRFSREQSRATKSAEWEQRVPPLEPWWKSIVGGLGLIAFMVVGTWIAWHLPEWGV